MKKFLASISIVAMCVGAVIASNNFVYNPDALGNIADLTTPTAYQLYPLGSKIIVQNYGNPALKEYVYVYANGALASGGVYNIVFSSVAGAEVETGTPASGTAITYMSGVAPAAFATGYYGFLQVAGDCTVTTSTNTTVGNYARVLSGLATAGDVGSTTISSTTFGIWKNSRYGKQSYAW